MKGIIFFLGLAFLFACNSHHNDDQQSDKDIKVEVVRIDSSKSMKQLMEDNMRQMMTSVESWGNPDPDFAALMRIHHHGAVEMANALLKSGTNNELRVMSQQIIIDQQKEIAVFDSLLSIKMGEGNDSAFFKKSMQQMHQMQLTDERSSIEREFIQMMIPHHEGAIVMAKTYLENGAKNAVLKKIANNIIKFKKNKYKKLQKKPSEKTNLYLT